MQMIVHLALAGARAFHAVLAAAAGPAVLDAPSVHQERDPATTPEERYDDLTPLVAEMRRLHPNLTFGISEEELTAAVEHLEDRLADLTDEGFAVELMRLVALAWGSGRDGHALAVPVGRLHVAGGWI